MTSLAIRCPQNPVIRPQDIPGGANCVFNSGACRYGGEVLLLLSVWGEDWSPRFHVARSRDGVRFDINPRNKIQPPAEYPYYPYGGLFDTRLCLLEGWYYITCNAASRLGGRILLYRTRDFDSIESLGFIAGPDHRNCALFPQRIGGEYVRLERPTLQDGSGDIYLSRSPDLVHWGRTELLLARGTRYWESAKIGPGPTPVKTGYGWLVIYHGCRQSVNGLQYNAGCLLLDLAEPTRILGKLRRPLLCPEEPYERAGNVPNVVFPTGAVLHGGEDELKIYYGAADTVMALATARASELARACLEDGPLSNDRPPFPRTGA